MQKESRFIVYYLDQLPMQSVDCIKFVASQKMNIDKFSCAGLPTSGVTEAIIKEKLATKDTAFFGEEYLKFLSSPDEAGTSFTGSVPAECEDIDLGLIHNINKMMNDLPESVKSVMITKLDNYMVL